MTGGSAPKRAARGSAAKGLSAERIVDAAVALADEHGVAKLSMRKLAGELGCEAMSIYNHLANKSELLDAMVDAVAAEIKLPGRDAEWKQGIHDVSASTFQALTRHPWAIELWTRQFPLPHRLTLMETLLGLLDRADLPEHLADTAFHAVHLHIVGFAQQATAYETAYDDDAEGRFDAEVSADDYPLLVAHKEYHDEVDHGTIEQPDTFSFVLGLILDGIERADHVTE